MFVLILKQLKEKSIKFIYTRGVYSDGAAQIEAERGYMNFFQKGELKRVEGN